MYEITVLADGYAGIQEYMLSADRPYDLAKNYLPACRSLDAFYLSHRQEAYDPAMNEKYREYIDQQVKNGIFSERCGRHHRRLTFMLDDYYSGRLDLRQYFGQKKSKDYAAFLSSSSSFCCGVR